MLSTAIWVVYRRGKLPPCTPTVIHWMPKLWRMVMGELLKLLFFNVCAIIGVHFVTRRDQLLGPLGDQVRKLPEFLSKPLTECPPCQSSVWGTLIFWTLWHESSFAKKLVLWPFYILALCGKVRLINLLLQTLKKEVNPTEPADE